MDTASILARLEEARAADSTARDRICDEVAAELLAAGSPPEFEVDSADFDTDPYVMAAGRYWRQRLQDRPSVATALECGRWIAGHVTDGSWIAVAEHWGLGNGFINRHSAESVGQLTAVAREIGELGDTAGQRVAYLVALFHGGRLRSNFCFDELHDFLASSPPALAAGAHREEPLFLALRSFAAFGSRALTVEYATDLLTRAWASPRRTRDTVDLCLNGLALAVPFEGQGELLRRHAEEAVEEYPRDHMFHARLAAGLHMCGRHDDALARIDTALALLGTKPAFSHNILQDQYLAKRDAIQEGRLRALRDAEQQRRWDQQIAANAQLERSLHTSSVRAVEVVAVFTAAIAFAVGSLQVTLTGKLPLSDRLYLLAAQGVGLAVFALLIVGGTWWITRRRQHEGRGEGWRRTGR
ncbi:hypothetical protein [Streptomyces sp. NPDC050355]|uniref:Tetratricopeptide repeat protein n=1 Tax=Streptomyces sirii TaxID=3127701 RepID=A0ABZ2QPU9_9ACTN